MKKYLFLLITIILFTPNSVLAATDLSQKDFDQAKKGDKSKGLAFSEEYNNYYFEEDGEYRLISDITLKNVIVINEADSNYKEGADDELSFTIDKEFEGDIFGKVYVDDKELDDDDFSISENTIIT